MGGYKLVGKVCYTQHQSDRTAWARCALVSPHVQAPSWQSLSDDLQREHAPVYTDCPLQTCSRALTVKGWIQLSIGAWEMDVWNNIFCVCACNHAFTFTDVIAEPMSCDVLVPSHGASIWFKCSSIKGSGESATIGGSGSTGTLSTSAVSPE